MGHLRPLFLKFVLSVAKMLMDGFEPRSSDVGSKRPSYCATTTAQLLTCLHLHLPTYLPTSIWTRIIWKTFFRKKKIGNETIDLRWRLKIAQNRKVFFHEDGNKGLNLYHTNWYVTRWEREREREGGGRKWERERELPKKKGETYKEDQRDVGKRWYRMVKRGWRLVLLYRERGTR